MKCIRLLFGIVMLLCVAASRCFAPPPLVTGDESRGLGSGEFDYDLRLRTQKTWGWFTAIGNVGYTIVTDPEYRSVQQSAENVWLLAFGQEYQVAKRTKLLSEIYFVSR